MNNAARPIAALRESCLKATALALMALFGVSAAPALAAPSIIVDARTGNVLYAEEATRPWNPASTTKMMTAYVALRAVSAGRLTLDTPLIASANAARQRPSKIGIRPGQEITLDNALKILMVKSANDLAVVVAEGIAGSVDDFAAMMNAEARRIGMRESNFRNPHGFHAPGHVTSARDLALLARTILTEFPQYNEYWGIGAVQLGNRVMKNTNGLIGRYPGAEGFKTGFVCASGFNVVATANRGGRQLIAVVLGAASGAERTIKAAQLLDKGFAEWGNSSSTSLLSLPSSGYDSAPDMRQDICRRGRSSVVLSDEAESDSAILFNEAMNRGGMEEATSATAFLLQQSRGQSPVGRSVGGQTPTGRVALGPRADFVPIAVRLGREPGNTAVAVGPGRPAVMVARAAPPPATPRDPVLAAPTTAFAPVAAAPVVPSTNRGAIGAPAAVAARPSGLEPAPIPTTTTIPTAQPAVAAVAEEPDAGEPLQLPGVFTAGPASASLLRTRDPGQGQSPAARPRLGAIEGRSPAQAAGLSASATPPNADALPTSVKAPKAERPKAAARKTNPKATAAKATAAKATAPKAKVPATSGTAPVL